MPVFSSGKHHPHHVVENSVNVSSSKITEAASLLDIERPSFETILTVMEEEKGDAEVRRREEKYNQPSRIRGRAQ